jgi:hypothetical protein
MTVALEATPQILALLLLAAAMAVGVWAYATRYPILPGARRWILLGARLLACAALVVASLAPVLRYPERSRSRNRLLLLVDHSGSMEVRDAGAGRSRRAAADSAAAAVAKSLASRFDVRAAAFDATLGPFGRGAAAVSQIASAPAGDGETALGDALRSALTRVDPDSVAAILVVSDGAVNRGEDPDRALGAALPAFGLIVGKPGEPATVGIAGVEVPPEAVVGRALPVVVTVREGSRSSSRGSVRVSEEGRLLGEAPFSLSGPGVSARVTVPVTIAERGKRFLSIELAGVADDPLRENKQRLVAITARPAKRLLPVLSREWDWDLRSLKRGVEEDTTWGVVLLEPSGAAQATRLGGAPASLDSYLEDAEAVAVRLDSQCVSPERAAALLRFIERGGGALLWVDPLARTPSSMPLTRALGIGFRYWGNPPGATATVELTPAGRTHEIALLGGDAVSAAAVWRDLPPIQPLIPLGTEGGPLTTLLVARVGAETTPLLLAGKIGKGRVAVLNAAGVYRWGLTAAGITGSTGIEGEFFGGLARWLSSGSEERPVRLAAPDITPVGRPVAVKLTVATPALAEGADAQVIARRLGGGKPSPPVEARLTPSGADFAGSLELEPGTYQLVGRLEREGRSIGSDSARVAVGSRGIEFEMLAAEPKVLRRLADDSGGLAAPLDSADVVLTRLRSPGLSRARLAEVDLFHNRILFLVLVGALALEWALRRRFHLM